MPHPARRIAHDRPLTALLGLAAALLLALGALYWAPALRVVFGERVDADGAARAILKVRLALLAGGVALGAAAWGLHRSAAARRALARPWVARAALALGLLVGPLLLLELLCRPFGPGWRTTVYRADPDYGWIHRPGVTDWIGSMVTINAHGLRGPYVPYERAPGARRILFLGDSIAFGFGIEDYADTFVARAGRLLGERLGMPVETINSGVGGWATWQQALWLEREGLRYEPDRIVLCFVLNDVPERFDGTQLTYSYHGNLDIALRHSALWYNLRRLRSDIGLTGEAREAAARLEKSGVHEMLRHPDAPEIMRLWELALADLARLDDIARAAGVPWTLVAFPYLMQVEAPEEYDDAQRRLETFARERGVPFVDLLPVYVAAVEARGIEPAALYIDDNHPSALGSEITARALAEALADNMAARESSD